MSPETLMLLVRALIFIFVLLTTFAYLTFVERRMLAWFTWRVGPNRVGPWGLLQPLADGVKTVLKQEMVPDNADKPLYFMAPVITLAAAFTMFALIPVGEGVWLSNVSVAILLFLGLSSLGAYGIILGGWASQTRYSFLGALRACAQVISYELALGLALLVPVMIVGSLNVKDIGDIYSSELYRSPYGPLVLLVLLPAGFLFFLAALAETGRVPFDLPEAEAELIAGYMTEYSSMKYAMFPMGEYIAMVAMSGICVHFFMGGYYLPFGLTNWVGMLVGDPSAAIGPPLFLGLSEPYWNALSLSMLGLSTVLTFIFKVAILVFIFMWIRATLPRFRYDQLMQFGWKIMLPTGLALVFLTAVLTTFLPGESDLSNTPEVTIDGSR